MATPGNKGLRKAGAAVFWIGVWQAASRLASHKLGSSLWLPGPWAVFTRLLVLMGQADFWLSALMTLARVLVGFLCAVPAGILFAALTQRYRFCRDLFSPLLRVIRSTPVSSFILLAILWLKKDVVPGFIAFLMVLPIIWANVSLGIEQTDGRLLEMAKLFRFSPGKTLRCIYMPSVIPYLMDACITGLGFAWKSGVAAEVLCTPRLSMGRYLYESKLYLETEDLFAWTAFVIVLSLLLELLLRKAITGFHAARSKGVRL